MDYAGLPLQNDSEGGPGILLTASSAIRMRTYENTFQIIGARKATVMSESAGCGEGSDAYKAMPGNDVPVITAREIYWSAKQ